MTHPKFRIASTLDRLGVNRLLFAAQRMLCSPCIRAVNYHDIPVREAQAFEAQLVYFQRHFEPVGLAELEAFLTGSWRPRRPGLIVSFDDGLRSHVEVAAPLLERYGIPGWFCVPAGLPDATVEDHARFRSEHHLHYDEQDYPDRRGVMSWDEIRALDRSGHVIVCHTTSHRRLSADLTPDELEFEIPGAKRRIEEQLGHPIAVFAWVGGEETSYSEAAARVIREAGFEYVLMTNNAPIRPHSDPRQLQRTNLESCHPPEFVRFSLSGAYDLFYTPKRRRVNRMTATPAG